MTYETQKEIVARAMRRVYDHRLTTTTGGNISFKDEQGVIHITPSGCDKAHLTANDIMSVYPDGRYEGPHKPSSEFPFHKHIYEARPDIFAIVHAHPPGLVAASTARVIPNLALVSGYETLQGKVAVAAYALPGSDTLGEHIAKKFKEGANAVILENHGVAIGGKDMQEALSHFEGLENLAVLELQTKRLTDKTMTFNPLPFPKFNSMKGHHDEVQTLASPLLELLTRSHRQKLLNGLIGTMSERMSDDQFMVTPSQGDRLELKDNDLLTINFDTQHDDVIIAIHQAIYRRHPNINNIIIAQPPHAMGFVASGEPIDTKIIPEGYILLKKIGRFNVTQLDAMIDQLSPAMPIAFLDNHFVIVVGPNLLQTFDRLEVLEFGAKSLIDARLYSKVYSIDDEEIDKLDEVFHVWS